MSISKRVYLFNLFIITVVSFEVFYSSFLISFAPKNAFFMLLIIYLISILFITLLPVNNQNLVLLIKNNKIIRLITTVYLFIFTTVILSYSTTLLNHWFYHKSPYVIVLIILTLCICYFSRSLRFIFNMGAILGIFLMLFNILPIFNSIPRTFDFILNFDLRSNYLFIFSSLFIFLDLILEIPFLNNVREKITKKHLVMTITFGTIFSLILLLENYFFFNSSFLTNAVNPNFLKYKIYFINYLIDNIDFILLFNILYYVIFKGSRYLYLLRTINQIKSIGTKKEVFLNNLVIFLSLAIISYSILNILYQDRLLIKNYTNLLNILIIIIYFYLFIKLWRLKYAKKGSKLLSNVD